MTSTSLTLRIENSGDLVMAGQDIGEAPEIFFGKDEYEYFVTVPSQHKDALLKQLVQDRFFADATPTSTFMKYLEEHDIPFQFDTW